jgi:hypothetical protein
MLARIETTNMTAKMIVTSNKFLSKPRLVVNSSPDDPKPAPNDAPLCCNNIATTIKKAEARVI